MKFIQPTRIVAGLATTGILAISGTSYAAGTASFALSGASVNEGDPVTLTISENGTSVNVVTATFTYDSSKLQLVSDSCGGAFPSMAASSSSSITCFVPGGSSAVNGSNTVASLKFNAVAAGSAAVTVNGADIYSGGANTWNGSTASAAVSIAAPAAPSAPSQPTQSGPNNTSSNNTTPSSNKSTSTGSTNATSNKPATTSGSTSATPAGSTSSTSSAIKGDSTNKKSGKKTVATSTGKKSNTSMVVSSISLLVIAGAAIAWFMLHKNTEVVPANKIYKLDTDTKSTTTTKKASGTKKPATKKK